jgi:hypothetical protein
MRNECITSPASTILKKNNPTNQITNSNAAVITNSDFIPTSTSYQHNLILVNMVFKIAPSWKNFHRQYTDL